MGDQTFNNRPVYMSMEVLHQTIAFLKAGCIDLEIETLIISFHGGEPLMMKKVLFKSFCETLHCELDGVVDLDLRLHTNAMLIDEEWISLFCKYNIGVGVSIDGTKEQHDIYRKDKKGRGTYDRVYQGILLLAKNKHIKKMGNYGLLCVINPANDAKSVYRHFVDNLHAKCIDFLLPHCTHDNPPPMPGILYGKYLIDIFNQWVEDDNPEIYVRIISSKIDIMLGGNSHQYGVGKAAEEEIPIICINSDGGITTTDEFRAMSNDLAYSNSFVNNISLQEYFKLPLFEKLSHAQEKLSDECDVCIWKTICHGGSIVTRFSVDNDFNNPSVYCDGLKVFYEEIRSYLEKNLPSEIYEVVKKQLNAQPEEKSVRLQNEYHEHLMS